MTYIQADTIGDSNIAQGIHAAEGASISIDQHVVTNNYYGQRPSASHVPKTLPPSEYVFDRVRETASFRNLVCEKGCRVVLISGMPGVGKTTCLKKWANEEKASYPDGQLYLDLEEYRRDGGVPAQSEILHHVLNMLLGWSNVDTADCDLAARYRDVTADKRLLIALDNALDMNEISALCPNSEHALVIAAGQSSFEECDARYGRVVVTCFEGTDALQYLGYRLVQGVGGLEGSELGSAISEKCNELRECGTELSAILRSCSGLPLVLNAAAHLLRSHAVEPCELVELLSDSQGMPSASADLRKLFALLDKTCERLGGDERIICRVLGELPPSLRGQNALEYAWLACGVGEGDSYRLRFALDKLKDVQLIELRMPPRGGRNLGGGRKIFMHRQVAAHAASGYGRSSQEITDLIKGVVRYYRVFAQQLDYANTESRLRLYKKVDVGFFDKRGCITPKSAFDVFFGHMEEFPAALDLAFKHGAYEDAAAIAEALWVFYYENAMYEAGSAFFEKGYQAAKRLTEPEAASRLLALVSRCKLLMGDFAGAEDCLNRAREGLKDSENWVLRGSVEEFSGSLELEQGDYDAAIEHYECAKREHRKNGGEWPRGAIIAEYLIISAYERAGLFTEAEVAAKALLDVMPDTLDATTRVKVLTKHAAILRWLQRFPEAFDAARTAVSACEEFGLHAREGKALELAADILVDSKAPVSAVKERLTTCRDCYAKAGMSSDAERIDARLSLLTDE